MIEVLIQEQRTDRRSPCATVVRVGPLGADYDGPNTGAEILAWALGGATTPRGFYPVAIHFSGFSAGETPTAGVLVSKESTP